MCLKTKEILSESGNVVENKGGRWGRAGFRSQNEEHLLSADCLLLTADCLLQWWVTDGRW
jgi:hypothetical protein